MRLFQRFLCLFLVSIFNTVLTQAAQISNNVAPWLNQAKMMGRANPRGRVVISVYLPIRNEAGLRALIHDLYTRGNPQYRQFLSPEQFRAAFSPAAEDVGAVSTFLAQKGLKVEYTPANSMYVDASGTTGQIETAFAITENQYDYKG